MKKRIMQKFYKKQGWIAFLLFSLFCMLIFGIWMSSGAWFGDKDKANININLAEIEITSDMSKSLKTTAYVAQKNQIILDQDITFAVTKTGSELYARFGVFVTTDSSNSLVAKDIVKFQNFVPTQNDGYTWVRDGEWYYFCKDGKPAILEADTTKTYGFMAKDSFVMPNGIRPQHYLSDSKINLEIRVESVQARNIPGDSVSSLAPYFTTQYPTDTYTVKFMDLDGNELSSQRVSYAGDVTTPNAPQAPAGKGEFVCWNTLKDGTGADIIGEEFNNISQNLTLYPKYMSNEYVVTVIQTENGVITPGTTTARYGETLSFVVKPNGGYKISSITVGGANVEITNVNEQTVVIENIVGDTTLTATYEAKQYLISIVSEGDGETSPSGDQQIAFGNSLTISFAARDGNYISSLKIDGVEQIKTEIETWKEYTFDDVSADHSVHVVYSVRVFKLSTIVEAHADGYTYGRITPESSNCEFGNSVSFVVEAFDGARISSLKIREKEQIYSYENLSRKVVEVTPTSSDENEITIEATFEPLWTVVQTGSNFYITAYLWTDTDIVVPASIYWKGANISVYGVKSLANNNITKLTISDGIEVIGGNGGNNILGATTNSTLTSVTLPNSVTTIDSNAFLGCTKLSSINMPAELNTIGQAAFSGCTKLGEIEFPATLTSIGDMAFYGDDLEVVTFTSTTCPNVDTGTFSGPKNTVKVRVPLESKASYVSGLSNSGFDWGTYMYGPIGEVPFAKNIDNVFKYIYYLEIINGSGGTYVTSEQSTSSNKDQKIEVYDGQNFSVTFTPDEGNTINAIYLDSREVNLVNVSKGESQTYTFTNISSGHSIYCYYKAIAYEITTAVVAHTDGYAYGKITPDAAICDKGSSATFVVEAFDGARISSIMVGDVEQTITDSTRTTLSVTPDCDTVVKATFEPLWTVVQTGSNFYITAYLGEETDLIVPASIYWKGANISVYGVKSLANNNIAKLTVSDGIEVIGGNGDNNILGATTNSTLTSVTLPNSVTTIDAYAFLGCAQLSSINIPAELNTIGEAAFSGCTQLVEIEFPAREFEVGSKAFGGCSALQKMTFNHTSAPTATSDSFSDTPSTLKIYIPNGTIDAYAPTSNSKPSLHNLGFAQGATLHHIGQGSIVATCVGGVFKRNLEITISNAEYYYDGEEHSVLINETLPIGADVSYTIQKTKDGDGNAVTEGAQSGNGATDAGIYTIEATVTGDFYVSTTVSATLTIKKVTLSGISFNDKTVTYDTQPHSIAIIGALPTGASVSYTIQKTKDGRGNSAIGTPQSGNSATDAGTYTVTATFGGTLAGQTLSTTLTIEQADPRIKLEDKTITYDGASHTLNTPAMPSGVSISKSAVTGYEYDANHNLNTQVSGNISGGAIITRTEAGEYTITVNFSGGNNYKDSSASAMLIIRLATQSDNIQFASNLGWTYDGTAHTIAPNSASGKTISYSWTRADGLASGTGNSFTNAGTYTLTATVKGDKNHLDKKLTTKFTVQKANLTIDGTPNTVTTTYDGTEQTYTLSKGIKGVGGESFAASACSIKYSISGKEYSATDAAGASPTGASISRICGTNGAKATNAGLYTVKLAITAPTTTDGIQNYNVLETSAENVFKINRAQIDGITLADKTVTYNGKTQTLAATGSISGVNASYTIQGTEYDNSGNLSVAVALRSGNSATDAGIYTVAATLTGKNHVPQTLTAKLTINRASVGDLKFVGDTSWTYDAKYHEVKLNLSSDISVTYSWKKSEEKGTGNTFKNAGTYTLTATVSDKNYDSGEATTQITVNKATATVSDIPTMSVYYNGNPQSYSFTGEVTGVGGEVFSSSNCSISYVDGTKTNAGEYKVSFTVTPLSGNYNSLTVTPTSPNFIINRVTLNFELVSKTFTYDGQEHTIEMTGLSEGATFTSTISGNGYDQNGDPTVTVSPSTKTNALVTWKNAGVYTISVTASGTNFVESLTKTATLTILQDTLKDISIKVVETTYDGSSQSYVISDNVYSASNGAKITEANYSISYSLTGLEYALNDTDGNPTTTVSNLTGIATNAGLYKVSFTVTPNPVDGIYNYASRTMTPSSYNFIINRQTLAFNATQVSALSNTSFKNLFTTSFANSQTFTYSSSDTKNRVSFATAATTSNKQTFLITSNVVDRTSNSGKTVTITAGGNKNFTTASFTIELVPFVVSGNTITKYTSSYGTDGNEGGAVVIPGSITTNKITNGVVEEIKENTDGTTTATITTITRLGEISPVFDTTKTYESAQIYSSDLTISSFAFEGVNCAKLILGVSKAPFEEGRIFNKFEVIQLMKNFTESYDLSYFGTKIWRYDTYKGSIEVAQLKDLGFYRVYVEHNAVEVDYNGTKTYYSTLSDASVYASGKTTTITLYQSQTISTEISVGASTNMTIKCPNDGNNYDFTISRGKENINLFNVTGGTLTIDDQHLFIDGEMSIYTNSSSLIYVTAGTFNLKNGTLQYNEATNGGALYIASGNINMNGGTIQNCNATNGGAIDNAEGTLSINGGTIQNCSATNGGAIYISSESVSNTINGTIKITDCDAVLGGGIYSEYTATIGGNITNCSATQRGGGVYFKGYDKESQSSFESLTISALISKCKAIYGAGVNADAGEIIFDNCEIYECGSTDGETFGGGVSLYARGNGTLEGVQGYYIHALVCQFNTSVSIHDNKATNGGGLYIGSDDQSDYGSFIFSCDKDGVIYNNIASEKGGGIYITQANAYQLDNFKGANLRVFGNSVTNGEGGGMYIDSWKSYFDNSNINSGYPNHLYLTDIMIYDNSASKGSIIYAKNCRNIEVSGTTHFAGSLTKDSNGNTSYESGTIAFETNEINNDLFVCEGYNTSEQAWTGNTINNKIIQIIIEYMGSVSSNVVVYNNSAGRDASSECLPLSNVIVAAQGCTIYWEDIAGNWSDSIRISKNS